MWEWGLEQEGSIGNVLYRAANVVCVGSMHRELGDEGQDAVLHFPLDSYGDDGSDQHGFVCGVLDGHGEYGRAVADDGVDAWKAMCGCREMTASTRAVVINCCLGAPGVETLQHCICRTRLHVNTQHLDKSGFALTVARFLPLRSDASGGDGACVEVCVGNVGDAQCVMVVPAAWVGGESGGSGGAYTSEVLTMLHRVSNELEAARVLEEGGVIRGQYVYHPHDTDEATARVISLTRAIGDEEMIVAGVSDTPSMRVVQLNVTAGVGAVLIASDGLWDDVEMSEVVQALTALCNNAQSVDECGATLRSVIHLLPNGMPRCDGYYDEG